MIPALDENFSWSWQSSATPSNANQHFRIFSKIAVLYVGVGERDIEQKREREIKDCWEKNLVKEVIDKSFDGAGDRRRAYSMTDKCYVHFWYVCDKRCEMVYLQQREREQKMPFLVWQ